VSVITNYSTLQTAVQDYMARADLSTFVPNYIQNWEERFFRDPMNWAAWMETALNVTISSQVAALPADYLELVTAYIDGSPSTSLQRVPLKQMSLHFPRNAPVGYPVWIARSGANFIFGPVPDGAYTVKGVYYAKPTVIRSDGDGVNWLVTNAPDLMLYGALLEAEPFMRNDERFELWRALYTEALSAYRRQHKSENASGSPPQVRLA
jgi:hypothetical protein